MHHGGLVEALKAVPFDARGLSCKSCDEFALERCNLLLQHLLLHDPEFHAKCQRERLREMIRQSEFGERFWSEVEARVWRRFVQDRPTFRTPHHRPEIRVPAYVLAQDVDYAHAWLGHLRQYAPNVPLHLERVRAHEWMALAVSNVEERLEVRDKRWKIDGRAVACELIAWILDLPVRTVKRISRNERRVSASEVAHDERVVPGLLRNLQSLTEGSEAEWFSALRAAGMTKREETKILERWRSRD